MKLQERAAISLRLDAGSDLALRTILADQGAGDEPGSVGVTVAVKEALELYAGAIRAGWAQQARESGEWPAARRKLTVEFQRRLHASDVES